MSTPTFYTFNKFTLSLLVKTMGESLTVFNNFHLFFWPPCSTSPRCDGGTWWASGWPGGSFRGFQLTCFHHLVALTQWCVIKKKVSNKLLFTMRGQKEKVQLSLCCSWGRVKGLRVESVWGRCNVCSNHSAMGFPHPSPKLVAHHCCHLYDWAVARMNAKVSYNFSCD